MSSHSLGQTWEGMHFRVYDRSQERRGKWLCEALVATLCLVRALEGQGLDPSSGLELGLFT